MRFFDVYYRGELTRRCSTGIEFPIPGDVLVVDGKAYTVGTRVWNPEWSTPMRLYVVEAEFEVPA